MSFPALTGLGTVNGYLNIKAVSGGTVSMPKLAAVTGTSPYVQFDVEGVTSTLDLSALNSFVGSTNYVRIFDGGIVNFPNGIASMPYSDGATFTMPQLPTGLSALLQDDGTVNNTVLNIAANDNVLIQGGTWTGMTFNVAQGATVDLTNGQTTTYGGTLTGSGLGEVVLNSGRAAAASGGVTLNFPGSLFQWFPVNSNSGVFDASAGNVTNIGTVNVTETSAVGVVNGVFVNSGVLNIANTGSAILQATTSAGQYPSLGNVTFDGGLGNTLGNAQSFNAMSVDDGAVPTGFVNNSQFNTFSLTPNTYLSVSNTSDIAPATGGGAAIYANTLTVPQNSTLDLNNVHLYAQVLNVQGTIVHGSVTQVNFLPVITSPATATANENGSLKFLTISVQDEAAVGNSDTVTLTVSNGTLALGSTTGVTFNSGSNHSASMTIGGTLANLNSALSGLVYMPTTGYTGLDSLAISFLNSSDSLTGSSSVALTVVAPPRLTTPVTQSTPLNTALIFSTANSNPVSIAENGIGSNTVQLSLSAANGVLTLSTTSGLTVTSGANGTAAVTVKGTLAAINAAVSGLKFTPTNNYAGAASVTLNFSDLGVGGTEAAQAASKTIAITVTYPVYTVIDQAAGYAETGGTWATSAVNGYNGVATRSSSSPSATATWTPVLLAGAYQISFYNPATPGATTDAKITVVHNGTSNVYTVNEASGTAGFINLGILSFNGSGNESVSISQGSTAGTLNASAVQFTRVGNIPVVTGPATQNTPLNTNLIFSTANANAISIVDSSVNSNTVQLSLNALNGLLTLSTTSKSLVHSFRLGIVPVRFFG